jgi:hypothetical protein
MLNLKSLIDPSYFRVEEQEIRGLAFTFANELVENDPDYEFFPKEKIIEFYNEKIEKLQEEVCEQHNFVPIEHRLGIKGYCEDCYKKIKEEEK